MRRSLSRLALSALCALGAPAGWAAPGGLDLDITRTSLEDLYNLDITTLSRKQESFRRSAAAVFVITGEDLSRSEVSSIPEALRLVPGVQVARVDASKWAVSIRGFNGRTANKLLVLIDGRSVYNPLFGGVIWESRDVALEDVDRIEIVRGPGGALWGANAVNGVINIITKSAAETQGGLLRLGTGNEERALGLLRYGFRLGRAGHARAYVKAFDRDGGYTPAGPEIDDWNMIRGGFRTDFAIPGGSALTVSGDTYDGVVGEGFGPGAQRVDHSGRNVLAHWSAATRSGRTRYVQAYYDRTNLDNVVLGERRDTYDVEFQETRDAGRHGIVWGAGYRLTEDRIANSPFLEVTPAASRQGLASAFAQFDFAPHDAAHRTLFGLKIERNDFTGVELQPSLRHSWSASNAVTLWGAISRAVRTPSRLEVDLSAPISGSRGLRAETLRAHELGVRWFNAARALDATVFWNAYDDLVTLESAALGNKMRGDTYGIEAHAGWQVLGTWRIDATGHYLWMDLRLKDGSAGLTDPEAIERNEPSYQLALRNAFKATRRLDLDATLRHTAGVDTQGMPSSTLLDLALHWSPSSSLTLSLSGRHLLESHHPEQAGPSATQVEQEVSARLRLTF